MMPLKPALFAKTVPILGNCCATLLLGGIMINPLSLKPAAAADIATTYHHSCAACHDTGALNAIKKGDSTVWQQRIQQKTLPTLVDSIKGGLIQMPAGGLCDTCSDEEYRQLIEYMSE